MTTPPEHPDGIEYRLDAEHIRSICQAVRPGATVQVTHVDQPPHVNVNVEYPYGAAESLDRVGYLTEFPDDWATRNRLVVTGWSTHQLHARAAALTGILDRFHGTLADVAARAIDLYALNSPGEYPDIARRAAVRRAIHLLQRETELITGPHAAHDPHIRPRDDTQARLLTDNQRLEHAIAAHIREAARVAGYAIAAYTADPNARTEPAEARSRAITSAMGRHSADIRSEYAARRTTSTPSPSPLARGSGDHPAAVAASDQPTTATPMTRATTDTATELASTPPPPTPPGGRTP